jgi:hypothetical protein
MLLAIGITINILWIPLICIVFAFAGFSFRSLQLNRLREQLRESEKKMLENDAEILSLQKENIDLQEKMKNNPVPVIPITTKENPENLPDTNTRKKLLGKSSANQHS